MTTRIIIQNAGPNDVDIHREDLGKDEKGNATSTMTRTHTLKVGEKAPALYVHDAMRIHVHEVPHPVNGPSTEAPPAPENPATKS